MWHLYFLLLLWTILYIMNSLVCLECVNSGNTSAFLFHMCQTFQAFLDCSYSNELLNKIILTWLTKWLRMVKNGIWWSPAASLNFHYYRWLILLTTTDNELSFSSFSPSLKSLHSLFSLTYKHFRDDNLVSCFPALLSCATREICKKFLKQGRFYFFFFSRMSMFCSSYF